MSSQDSYPLTLERKVRFLLLLLPRISHHDVFMPCTASSPTWKMTLPKDRLPDGGQSLVVQRRGPG
ncbi:hypothetical protein MHYP_G00072760 [Metynnis hypsauchen]